MKNAVLMVGVLMALSACAITERNDYKEGSGKGRPLDMPPDLVLPKGDARYNVPDGAGEGSATYSDYARGNKAAPAQGAACTCPNGGVNAAPVPAASAVPPAKAAAVLQDKPGKGRVISIAEPFDRCWLRVSQAIDAAAIVPEDKDRSKGLFYLKGGTQLSVQGQAASPSCEVSASDGNGKSGPESRRVIEVLYQALGK